MFSLSVKQKSEKKLIVLTWETISSQRKNKKENISSYPIKVGEKFFIVLIHFVLK